MTDSDKKLDPPLCPIHGTDCLQEKQIVSIEERLSALVERVGIMDRTGTKGLARISDQITGAERARALQLDELVVGVRRLNAWAPSVDKHFQSFSDRQGELSEKVEALSDEVRELQGIVKNGNGHA